MLNKKIDFRFVWALFMLIIYFGMAFILVFTNIFDFNPLLRIFFGIAFLLYGVFRAYRVWKYNK